MTAVWGWACVAMLALPGCVAPETRLPAAPESRTASRIIVVRHAEKDTTTSTPDPGLSPAGSARAQRISLRLQTADVQAVYVTGYRRTRATGLPTAQAHGMPVTVYAADGSAGALVNRLRTSHAAGTVLVVGHSNTVPDIVSALCRCAVAPIDESRYDHWYEVRIDAAGAPRLEHVLY